MEFAKENVKIALVARKDKLLNAISKKINVRGDSLSKVFPFDLRDNPKIPALIKQIESAFGKKVDILVNAAGIATLGYVENIPIGEYYFFSMLTAISIKFTLKNLGVNGIKFKWPNDIFFENNKLGGMILETYNSKKIIINM